MTGRPSRFAGMFQRASVGSDFIDFDDNTLQRDTSTEDPPRQRRPLSSRDGVLNPQATDFLPTSRTSTKRKASSSVITKTEASSFSAATILPTAAGSPHDPVIQSYEIFASAGFTNQTTITHGSDHDHVSPGMSAEEAYLRTLVYDDDDELQAAFNDQNRMLEFMSSLVSGSHGSSKRTLQTQQIVKDDDRITSAILYTTSGSRHRINEKRAFTSLAWMNYLPLVLTAVSNSDTKARAFKILPVCRRQIDARLNELPFDDLYWPANEMPMELFELIANHLPQDDVKSLRLVNKEFESKVSPSLFRSAVVPFNTELYDMIDEDTRSGARGGHTRDKGNGRARNVAAPREDSVEGMRLHWKNAKDDADDKVYRGHGLRVFQGFGPRIRRFGMSFEVSETQLHDTPEKKELNEVNSYHGKYDWPPQYYARFANLAGLENTADETSRMVSAFSKLVNVQELGLSIDSGLGRLNGLDVSTYSTIFSRPHPIFNDPDGLNHRYASGAGALWTALKRSHYSVGTSTSLKEQSLRHKVIPGGISALPELHQSLYSDPGLWPTAQTKSTNLETDGASDGAETGILTTTPDSLGPQSSQHMTSVATLRRDQKEWLLETEWAQRAFLESWILAVVDNRNVFQGVHTLNLAKISSGLIPILRREHFWNAFPRLENVMLCINPDWRSVSRDSAGYAETTTKSPSDAVGPFYHLIATQIAQLESVKKLRLGYTDGGEHAQGLFARNVNVLPAPVIAAGHSALAAPTLCVRFPYLEQLELYNCWITPTALRFFVHQHANLSLRSLTLDSLSLTANPRIPHNNGGMAGAGPVAAVLGNVPALAQVHFNQGQAPNFVPAQSIAPAQGLAPWQNMAAGNPVAPPNHNAVAAQVAALNAQAPIVPAPPPLQISNNSSHWATNARIGSWTQILDTISPGPRLADYLPKPPLWEEQPPPRPASALKTLTLKSCGYVRLNANFFDQSTFDGILSHHTYSAWFKQRQSALTQLVMTSKDGYLGKIVQALPAGEGNALLLGWGLREGWEDRVAAEGVEFDGLFAGGRGRISGVIHEG